MTISKRRTRNKRTNRKKKIKNKISKKRKERIIKRRKTIRKWKKIFGGGPKEEEETDYTSIWGNIEEKTTGEINHYFKQKTRDFLSSIKKGNLTESLHKFIPIDNPEILHFFTTSNNLKNLGKAGKVGIIYYLQLNNGEKIILKMNKGEGEFMIDQHDHEDIYSHFKKFTKNCQTHIPIERFAALNEFPNDTIIGFNIGNEVDHNINIKSNAYVKQYDAFIINGDSMNVMEFADKGNLMEFTEMFKENKRTLPSSKPGEQVRQSNYVDKNNGMLDPEIVLNIIIQIYSILHFLQTNNDYVHADLKNQNVFVSSEPFSGRYDGVNLPSAPFTAKIADFGKNSMTIDSKRFYMAPPSTTGLSIVSNLYKKQFKLKIREKRGVRYFKLPKQLDEVSTYLISRHSGIPMLKELDVYSFFISLYLTDGFHQAFKYHNQLKELWNMLWISNDQNVMITQYLDTVRKKGKRVGIGTIFGIMSKKRLKLICGNYDKIWKKLKKFITDNKLNLVIEGPTGN